MPQRLLLQVNEILEERFDCEIFRLSDHDGQRLLTLLVWMDRYKVPLDYILATVVPYFRERVKRHTRTSSKGLGFRIPTLVGKKAENLLQEQIKTDYSQGENFSIWRWDRIQEIAKQRTQDELEDTRNKGVTDYPTLKKYVKAYRQRVERKQKEFETEINRRTNTRRHYRNSPWF